MVPTLYREGGLSVRMYPNDHNPPHVHVVSAEGAVRITLGDEDTRPKVISSVRMSPPDEIRAVRLVESHQAALIEAWEEMHDYPLDPGHPGRAGAGARGRARGGPP